MTINDASATDKSQWKNGLLVSPESLNPSMLDDSLGFALRKAYQYAHGEVTKVLNHFDLRPQDFAVMAIIRANPGRTQTVISSAYGIQKTNFVGLITNLEHRHLVERRKVVGNRRVFALHLTSAGESMLSKIEVGHSHYEKKLEARIGAAQSRQLLDLLHNFING